MIVAADDRDRIGPYRVLKAIGAGGSARIDLARIDRAYNFQRHVVLKRPLEHLRDDPKAAASLRREARIGGMLRHPNLVAILDAGVHDNYDYLVLEYVHGASLRTAMQTDGPDTGAPGRVADMPLAVALAIAIDTARGLHAAHELTDASGAPLGLVHRDVAPGNVLLGLDGTVKLADFGIAKETRVTTLSGSLHGTVTYMAPEQCRGHAFDRRADVFSLGVILYELVTGTRLFWADNDVASLHRVLSGQVPRPRSVRPELPAALEEIVMSALAAEPERRCPTALAFAVALERFAADHGEPLAAREIARWMHDLLGPREVPWFGSVTQVDLGKTAGEGSLVEIIAATPDDLAPRAESFGPQDGSSVDAGIEPAAELVAAAQSQHRGRRIWVSALVASGLIGVGLVAAQLVTKSASSGSTTTSSSGSSGPSTTSSVGSSADTSATSSAGSSTSPGPTSSGSSTTSSVRTSTGSSPASSEPSTDTTAGSSAGSPTTSPTISSTTSRKRVRAKTAAKSGPDAQAAPPTPAGSASGSSSASKPKPNKVEWDPTILLPTDRSGSKK